VSIKEKALEIKGDSAPAVAGKNDGISESFFSLDEPYQNPQSGLTGTKLSGFMLAVLVAVSAGSYALGNYAGKSGGMPEPVP
jgi:hypothetical protein